MTSSAVPFLDLARAAAEEREGLEAALLASVRSGRYILGEEVAAFEREWAAFGVVEVDQALVERAAALAMKHALRSLDALHLAAALILPRQDLVVGTWDRPVHAAAEAEGFVLLPETLG